MRRDDAADRLMILPADDKQCIRLVRIPPDLEGPAAFRHVTGLIAQVEEEQPGCSGDDIVAALEDHGFEIVPFQLGPALD